MVLLGVDVSHYQAATPSLAGRSFLIAKASEGLTRDPAFGMHIANARRAGLVVGAYHFARDDVAIADQVVAFLAAAGDVTWLAFDVEGAHAWTPAQTAEAIAIVHRAGLTVGLYHSDSGYFDAGQDWRWIADWGSSPTHRYDVWQYRGSPLDLDRFDGTLAELRALAGQEEPMTPLPITDQTPALVTLQQPATFYNLDGTVQSTGHRVAGSHTSPYRASNGTNHFRALYAGPDPVRLVLIKPATIGPVPTADCTAAIAADRAKAKIVWG